MGSNKQSSISLDIARLGETLALYRFRKLSEIFRRRFKEPLNKSPSAVGGSFPPALRYQKREILRSRCRREPAYGCGIPLAGTYSIPPFSIPRLDEKPLAHSSCRFHQSFPRKIMDRQRNTLNSESETMFVSIQKGSRGAALGIAPAGQGAVNGMRYDIKVE